MSETNSRTGWDGTLLGTFTAAEVEAYGRLVRTFRALQDDVASMRFDHHVVSALADHLEEARLGLDGWAAEERHRVFGRIDELPVRGRPLLPELVIAESGPGHMRGTVVFGGWFLGAGAAVHGGVLALMFDDLLGRTAEPVSNPGLNRTAYLHVDYRHLVPLGVELAAEAWIDRVEGRKIYVRGELRLGDIVCVEAEALMLRLMPEQGTGRRPTAGTAD